jgi:flagellar protein FliS
MASNTPDQALGQYRTTGAYGAASAADRLQLILRMMEGALDRIATAKGHMQREETGRKCDEIGRAIKLVEGLRSCLDAEQGGEIAANLDVLYAYMSQRLLEANLSDQPELLDEVFALLSEIKSGWQQLAANPPPLSSPVAPGSIA